MYDRKESKQKSQRHWSLLHICHIVCEVPKNNSFFKYCCARSYSCRLFCRLSLILGGASGGVLMIKSKNEGKRTTKIQILSNLIYILMVGITDINVGRASEWNILIHLGRLGVFNFGLICKFPRGIFSSCT